MGCLFFFFFPCLTLIFILFLSYSAVKPGKMYLVFLIIVTYQYHLRAPAHQQHLRKRGRALGNVPVGEDDGSSGLPKLLLRGSGPARTPEVVGGVEVGGVLAVPLPTRSLGSLVKPVCQPARLCPGRVRRSGAAGMLPRLQVPHPAPADSRQLLTTYFF